VEISTAAVREAAEFCHAGAWVAPVPALVVDQQAVVYANAAAVRLLGYDDANALVDLPLDRILHSDALAAELARREVLATTQQPLFGVPTKLRCCSGEPRQALANVFPVEVAGASHTLFTFESDVECGPRGKPLSAPAASDLGLELGWAVLESVSTPMLIQDLDTIVFVNAAARRFLRASDRAQIEGQSVMSIVHPDGVRAAIERVVFVFATHQGLRDVPLKLTALDGTVFHAEADAYPVRAENRWGALIVGRFLRDACAQASA
jgi:PAS domain-containing protein